jgi:hypothetical protein
MPSIQQQLSQQLSVLGLDPTIPINLAKHIRNDKSELFPDSYDRLLPPKKYTQVQVNQVQDLIREMVDLSSVEFHEMEQLALRLVIIDNKKSLQTIPSKQESLGDPIDPEWEAIDPRSNFD